jgi:hypothetical protein
MGRAWEMTTTSRFLRWRFWLVEEVVRWRFRIAGRVTLGAGSGCGM